MGKETLWEKVTARIMAELARKRPAPGVRFHSVRQLSERYGISAITSRRVLDELAARGIIEKIPRKGCFLRSVSASKRLKCVLFKALSELELSSPVFPALFGGIAREAGRCGLPLDWVSAGYLSRKPDRDDLVLLVYEPAWQDPALQQRVRRLAVPCACCHTAEPYEGISTVRADLALGAYRLMEHLLRKGHKRIAMISGDIKTRWFAPRFDGYYRALKEHGLGLDLELVVQTGGSDAKEDARAIRKLLALRVQPTAVFCANEFRALHVLDYCRRTGVKVPGDLAVACFDNTYEGTVCKPPLTTVDSFWERQGVEAVRLLVELAGTAERAPRDVLIEPELVVRQST